MSDNPSIGTYDEGPYLAFTINKGCVFRCVYCGAGGEAAFSKETQMSSGDVQRRALIALEEGVRKFRLTGGEPLDYRGVGSLLSFFAALPGAATAVNTAAYPVMRRRDDIRVEAGGNLRFVASLDSPHEATFSRVVGREGRFHEVMDGIEWLARRGLLKRLNMMVVQENRAEIPEMIDLCRRLGCNLKVSDIAKVAQGFARWDDHHVALSDIEAYLAERAVRSWIHPYTLRYGIPSRIYDIDGVLVTLKSSHHGSTYARQGPCRDCQHFPCEEGMYFMNSLPDGVLSACRLHGTGAAPDADMEGFRRALREMRALFDSTEHVAVDMRRAPRRSLLTLQAPARDVT